jgi:hypothetical protein
MDKRFGEQLTAQRCDGSVDRLNEDALVCNLALRR